LRIFKTRLFAKFARLERIPDASLREAIERAGRGVIKQRVGRRGQGRSRGYRTLIAYRFGEFAVFLFGFAKSDRDNIDASELYVLRANAGQWLADSSKIAKDAGAGILIEVKDDDDKG
jgi:hypothetical protein